MPGGYNTTLYLRNETINLYPVCYSHTINKNGDVYDQFRERFLPRIEIDGIDHVELPGYLFGHPPDTTLLIKNAVLIGVAYKLSGMFNLMHVSRLDMMYKDGNPKNLHPDNLVWKFPAEGLPVFGLEGFYYIPGYSNYAISADGRLISFFKGGFKKTPFSLNNRSEQEASMVRDSGYSTGVRIYRLLALTFVPYPVNVAELEVDHIDMDVDNISHSNLEWVTREENMQRAANKLGRKLFGATPNYDLTEIPTVRRHNDNVRIDLKDLLTDRAVTYESINAAATVLGISTNNIYQVLNQPGHSGVILKRYIVRRSGQEWPDITKDDINYGAGGKRPMLAKNVTSGEITEYASAKDFYTTHGFSKKVVTVALKKNNQRQVGDFIFKYKDLDTLWRM